MRQPISFKDKDGRFNTRILADRANLAHKDSRKFDQAKLKRRFLALQNGKKYGCQFNTSTSEQVNESFDSI
jgi:hypothetical protein